MEKRKIIDTIRNTVGHDFDYRDVELKVDFIYRQLVSQLPASKLSRFDFLTKEYPTVTVSEDSTSGRYYSDLPAEVVYSASPTDGVRYINTLQGTDMNFYPTTEHNLALLGGLNADTVNTRIGYYVRYNRVWYHNMNDIIANVGVRMVLSVPFTEFTDTEDIPLPSGQDYNIVQATIDLLLQKQPPQIKEQDG